MCKTKNFEWVEMGKQNEKKQKDKLKGPDASEFPAL